MNNANVQEFLNTLTEEQHAAVCACKTEEDLEKVIDDYDIDLPDEMLADVAGGRGRFASLLLAGILTMSVASSTVLPVAAASDIVDTVDSHSETESDPDIDFTVPETDAAETENAEEAEAASEETTAEAETEAATEAQEEESLEDYLRRIAPSDKGTLLVEQGESPQFDRSSANYTKQEGSNFVVVTRKLESLQNNGADIATLEGTVGDLYPGAVVHADSKLVDGCPNLLPIEDEERKPLPLYLDIAGNTLPSQKVENVSLGTVNPKVNEMLKNWFAGGNVAAAKADYKYIMVHSEKQLDMALGVKGAADKYSVDASACMKGEKKTMLVVFNQLYYTVRTPQTTAAKLFAESVTPARFKRLGVNESNPGLAEITSMSYGRQIIVKLETDNTSAEVETAWKASLSANEIKASAKYKDIMDNTTFSMCAYGGNASTVGKLMKVSTIAEINDALEADLEFTANTPAVPLSYSTTFIDDASKATVNRTTEYVATNRQVRKPIKFEVDAASAWSEKSQCLYGRKITGIDQDGNLQLGGWEKICSDKGNVKKNNVSGAYAEFGFEVDVTWGTDWPYSDVFWTKDDGVVESIKVDTGGTCRMVNVKIDVNDNTVFEKKNCDSHSRHSW